MSDQKVHALFIYTPDFKKVFTIGGWSQKSLDLLANISLKCAALFPEEGMELGKAADVKSATDKEAVTKDATSAGGTAGKVPSKRTIKIPKKEVAVAWVQAGGDIAKYIMGSILQPDAILASMPKKDYFQYVFPRLTVDSCNPPVRDGQVASNLRQYKKGRNYFSHLSG